MRSAVVIAVVLLGLIAMLRTRFAGLNLYIWFALFRPQEWAWSAISSLRLSLVIFVTFVLSSLATGIGPNVTHPITLLTVLFIVPILVAQTNAIDPAVGWTWLQMLATTMTISLFLVRLTDTRQRFVWVLCIAAASLGIFGAKYGVGFLLRGGARFTTGIGGMFSDNNDFALGVARIFFLVIASAQNAPRRWARAAFALAVPCCVLGVISTYSRGGFIGLAVGTVVFLLLQRRRFLAISAAGATVALTLLVAPIPDDYYERLNTIRTYEEVNDRSAISRLHFWRVALEMARDQPLGVGLKNFELNYDQYDPTGGEYGSRRAVHSTHFQVLAETGVVGFLLYSLLIGASVVLAVRVRARSWTPGLTDDERRFLFTCANGLIASIAVFVAGGTFVSQLLNDLNWFTFALVASLDRVSRQMVEARERPGAAAHAPALLLAVPGTTLAPLVP